MVRMAYFARDVSVIGIKHVFNPNSSALRRTIWVSLILIGSGLSAFLVSNRIQYYVDEPVTVRVDIQTMNRLTFPGVTLCSDSFLGRLWFTERNLSHIVGDVALFLNHALKYNLSCLEDTACRNRMKEWPIPVETEQFPVIVAAMASKLLPLCSFQSKECTNKSIIRLTNKGGCITVGAASEGLLHSKGTGISQGLEIVLAAIEQDILVPDETMGFRIKLHDPYEHEFTMRESPILIEPDHHVYIAITPKVSELLNRPGAECESDPSYSEKQCDRKCFTQHSLDTCNCTLVHSHDFRNLCKNIFGFQCYQVALKSYYSDNTKKLECGCLPQCVTETYNLMISSAKTDPTYKQYIAKAAGYEIDKTDLSHLRISFISIYFNSISVERTIQQYAYSFWSLLAEIGGALGLFVGSALFTLIEILDFAITSMLMKQRKLSRMNTRNSVTKVHVTEAY